MFKKIKETFILSSLIAYGQASSVDSLCMQECHKHAECLTTSTGEHQCVCRPGFRGDGQDCSPQFTLQVQLCQDENKKALPKALKQASNKPSESMLLNIWMEDGENEWQQAINYQVPSLEFPTTFNYYENINIRHITKIKVLQENWQNLCLQRLSIHQGNSDIHLLAEMDAKAFVPDWADCSDPSDMTRCFKFAWWKKKCVAKKRIDGEGEACRSRMIYKRQAGSKLLRTTCETETCHKNAECSIQGGRVNCTCKDGYSGDGKSCKDIDECEEGTHTCGANATCKNTGGSFQCSCAEGFFGNGQVCSQMCSEETLPKNMIISQKDAKVKNKGGIYPAGCKAGSSIFPAHGIDQQMTTYKLNCTCSETECSWISEPSFTCQTGCPFLHPGKISKLKHWEDDRDSKLNQIKFKVKFRSPSQIPEEWRLLVTFGTDIPEGVRYGGPTAKMLQMSRNQLLLGGDLDNSHNPDLKVAPNKDIGFTFKLRNLKKKFLKSLVKGMTLHHVGHEVNDLSCFQDLPEEKLAIDYESYEESEEPEETFYEEV